MSHALKDKGGHAAPSLVFSLGFFSLAMQALLFREHAMAYSGNEVGTSLFLGSWLAWTGLGALAARLLFKWNSREPLTILLLLYAPVSMAELFCLWNLRQWAGLSATDLFPMDQLAALTLVATAPFSLLTGMLFVGSTEARRQAPEAKGRWNVGHLFALEALGGVVGGACVTLAFGLEMPTSWLYLLLLALWTLSTSVVLYERDEVSFSVVQAVLLAVLVGWSVFGGAQHLASWRLASVQLSPEYRVLDDFDTPESHVTLAQFHGSTALFTDGRLSAVYPDGGESRLLAAAMASSLPAGPHSVLILGQEQESLVCELSRLEGWSVTWVHAQKQLYQRLQNHLPAELKACLETPAAHVILQQPVDFLASDRGLYDLIALEFPDPTSSAASRYLTPEFLRAVAERVSPIGLVTMDLPLPPADVGEAVSAYAASAWATFSHVYPSVSIAVGDSLRFWATAGGRLPITPDQMVAGFAAVQSQFPDLLAEHLLELFEASRTQEWRERLGRSMDARPFEESRPASYLYHLRMVERESHLLALLGRPSSEHVVPFLLGIAAFLASWLIWGIGRRSRPLRLAGLQTPVAGFVGMVSQMVLLLLFQFRHGDLPLHFALLNGAYMLGLALSGATSLLAERVKGGAHRWLLGMGGVVALAVCPLGNLGLLLWPWATPGVAVFVVASTLVGAGSGIALVLASAELADIQPSGPTAASFFQSLDSLGAVAGAFVAGLIWIPSLGFARVLGMLALITLALGVLQLLGLLGWVGSASDRRGGDPFQTGPNRWVPGPVTRRIMLWALLLAVALQLRPQHQVAPKSSSALGSGSSVQEPSQPLTEGPKSVFTAAYAPDVTGYGGPLDLLMSVDGQERITALAMHRHNETPEYLEELDRFLAGFRGKEAPLIEYGQPEKPNGVNAMTGATVTGMAVVESVKRTGLALRQHRLEASSAASGEASQGTPGTGIEGGTSQSQTGESASPWLHWKVWVIGAFGLLGVALYFVGTSLLRQVFLWGVVAVLGFWLNAQVTLSESLRLLGSSVPWGNVPLLVGLCTLLLGLLLAGPVFCGYLCPFGALQELLSQWGLRWRATLATERRLRRVKYLVAVVALAGSVAVGVDRAFLFDPLTYAFSLHWDVLAVAMLLLLLAGSLVWFRPWCRYLCPLGALCSLGETIAAASRLAPKRKFSRCHLGVQEGHDMDCIRCNRCVSMRQPKARFWRKAWSETLLWVFVAAALGLGVGRLLVPAAAPASSLASQPPKEQTTLPTGIPAPETSTAPQGAGQSAAPGTQEVQGTTGAGKQGEPSRVTGLMRTENAQHPEQRDVDLPVLLEKIRNSEASSKEALFYQVVP